MNALNRVIVVVFYAAFAVLGLVLAGEGRFLCLGVCGTGAAAGFFFVGWLRKAIGAPRPYQVTGIAPAIGRDGENDSFPSRHAFCAALISLCWGVAGFPAVCAVLLALTALLAFLRVQGGVHYAKDVIAGAALALPFAGLMAILLLVL
ncbi:MAG: phosphatase PAP2 family protein [Eggerthellaceae bacterium]|nr:phosphatase PAP2 family protein [Eggerthellaceae bacterium]